MNLGLKVSSFTGVQKKNSYTLWPMESNSSKCPSIQTVHSTELKLGMYIIGHSSTHCVDFGEFRFNSFFLQECKNVFLFITPYTVKFSEAC